MPNVNRPSEQSLIDIEKLRKEDLVLLLDSFVKDEPEAKRNKILCDASSFDAHDLRRYLRNNFMRSYKTENFDDSYAVKEAELQDSMEKNDELIKKVAKLEKERNDAQRILSDIQKKYDLLKEEKKTLDVTYEKISKDITEKNNLLEERLLEIEQLRLVRDGFQNDLHEAMSVNKDESRMAITLLNFCLKVISIITIEMDSNSNLPDKFKISLESFLESCEETLEIFDKIEPTVGEKLKMSDHELSNTPPADVETTNLRIISKIEAGYKFKGKVLRKAKVAVG